jgi:Flp pilus assembly pilin Flp
MGLAMADRRSPCEQRGIIRRLQHFFVDETGATSVEYAVILMMIFAVVITGVQLVGQSTANSLQASSDKLDQASQ